MSNNNTGAFIFLCLTNKRLKYLLLSNKFIYVILYQYNDNQDKGVFELKIAVMYFFNQAGTKPLTTKNIDYETRGVSPFLAWGDFHVRSRFARSTIPEGKWGTTRSLRKI